VTEILSDEALAFVADLNRQFRPRRNELLAARARRRALIAGAAVAGALAVLALPLGVALPGVLGAWWTALFWLALAAADWLAVERLRRRAAADAVPSAVAALIAAICLVDALMVAPVSLAAATACVAGYLATRLAQRVVPGT
jgi:hypothetical protein